MERPEKSRWGPFNQTLSSGDLRSTIRARSGDRHDQNLETGTIRQAQRPVQSKSGDRHDRSLTCFFRSHDIHTLRCGLTPCAPNLMNLCSRRSPDTHTLPCSRRSPDRARLNRLRALLTVRVKWPCASNLITPIPLVQSKPRFSYNKIKILETYGQPCVLGQETGTNKVWRPVRSKFWRPARTSLETGTIKTMRARSGDRHDQILETYGQRSVHGLETGTIEGFGHRPGASESGIPLLLF